MRFGKGNGIFGEAACESFNKKIFSNCPIPVCSVIIEV